MQSLSTEKAIHFAKKKFEKQFLKDMSLTKISAPIFVYADSGIQDRLNGVKQPVCFKAKSINGACYEIVHSLAKWKRQALARYCVPAGEGICTDMRALRPDEDDLSSSIHSIYIDQWDWEKTIDENDKSLNFLEKNVLKIYQSIKKTEVAVTEQFALTPFLPEKIEFIQSEELAKLWPKCSPMERENKICYEKKSVFVIGIGHPLSDGERHDGRAPDYDDWSTSSEDGYFGLNGDILVWNPVLDRSFEISSMGIRVDKTSLLRQLKMLDCMHLVDQPWYQSLLQDKMPRSIGGGIGQSRLVMLLLQKRHIGEVQVSAWPADVLQQCQQNKIELLS